MPDRRDPWHRRRLYDGDVWWQDVIRWTIQGVRVLAVPTVLLSLLLVVDAVLPGTTEEGLPYARSVEDPWLQPTGIAVDLVRLGPANCSERRGGNTVLFAERPGCSLRVSVHPQFGARIGGRDTLQVMRTPMLQWIRQVRGPGETMVHEATALRRIVFYVLLGFVPLLSFGRGFALSPVQGGADRRFMIYVVPALLAEGVFIGIALQALGMV
jgi:hypothetical protein